MKAKFIKELRKGLGQISNTIESMVGTIEEANTQATDDVYEFACRYKDCDKSYGHESTRSAHENKVHGKTLPQKRRKDDNLGTDED